MEAPIGNRPAKVVFLFTTFPVVSETFLQREIKELLDTGVCMELVSLFGGADSWKEKPIQRCGIARALSGILWLPYWLVKKPAVVFEFLRELWRPRSSGFINWMENLLGAGYALQSARRWQKDNPSHFHGVWASAPAMGAWMLSELTGIPFSFAGHAYDLFEHGGDGWLKGKIAAAAWIRTSTRTSKARFIELGAPEEKVLLIRRGLGSFPPAPRPRSMATPLRVLCVGRMVDKMGHDRQIPIFSDFKEAGVEFTVEWVGDGPERNRLEKAIRRSGLQEHVHFRGRIPFEEVISLLESSDLFLFTGRVDRNGDRAGLPNAVAEAMAWGLPVFASDVGAVREAVEHGVTGFILSNDPSGREIVEILADEDLINRCRTRAYAWVSEHYDLKINLDQLRRRLCHVTFPGSQG